VTLAKPGTNPTRLALCKFTYYTLVNGLIHTICGVVVVYNSMLKGRRLVVRADYSRQLSMYGLSR